MVKVLAAPLLKKYICLLSSQVPDFVDYLVTTVLSNSKMCLHAMQILRNISFHQSNRARLFASGK